MRRSRVAEIENSRKQDKKIDSVFGRWCVPRLCVRMGVCAHGRVCICVCVCVFVHEYVLEEDPAIYRGRRKNPSSMPPSPSLSEAGSW